jgi:cell division protein FtsQ
MAGKRQTVNNKFRLRGSRLGKTLLPVTLLTMLAAVSGLAWQRAHDGTAYPIRFVRVEGDTRHVDASQLRETVAPYLKDGYFATDLAKVEAAARRIPWIHYARVMRLWPDTILLRITEQVPSVRWGTKSLLNTEGVRFSPDNLKDFRQLPVIQGADGQEAFLLATLKKLSDRLSRNGLSVAALNFSQRRSLVVTMADGMEIRFGRQDPINALERFLASLPRLGEDKIKTIETVDLRYPNGFSLRLKEEPAHAERRREFITTDQTNMPI